nr:HNH endonuclease family protein [Catelliglobosispora koreensis]
MLSPRIASILLSLALISGCSGPGSPSQTTSKGPANSGSTKVSLQSLRIADPRPMKDYTRDRFAHWNKAGSNCDVRDTVLERDGKNINKTGCNITGGEWFSVYDGQTLTDPLKVDIDHMVPLANAWRSGADVWDDKKRSAFANDLERPQLRAVSASSNRSKGDQDPSQWKPPSKDFWCQYAQEWIAVKSFWELTVTKDEKAALTEMLGTCS